MVARNAVDHDHVCRGPVLDGRPRLALVVGAILKTQIVGANTSVSCKASCTTLIVHFIVACKESIPVKV